jgi:hypothetical protein
MNCVPESSNFGFSRRFTRFYVRSHEQKDRSACFINTCGVNESCIQRNRVISQRTIRCDGQECFLLSKDFNLLRPVARVSLRRELKGKSSRSRREQTSYVSDSSVVKAKSAVARATAEHVGTPLLRLCPYLSVKHFTTKKHQLKISSEQFGAFRLGLLQGCFCGFRQFLDFRKEVDPFLGDEFFGFHRVYLAVHIRLLTMGCYIRSLGGLRLNAREAEFSIVRRCHV